MSYVERVLEESNGFIKDFVNKKLRDICDHLTIFYSYLAIPRQGFKEVKNPFWLTTNKCIKILSDKDIENFKSKKGKKAEVKKEELIEHQGLLRCGRPLVNKFFCEIHKNANLNDNVIDELTSSKRITSRMVEYLFTDIYNCKNFTTLTNISEFTHKEKEFIILEIYKSVDANIDFPIDKLLLNYYIKDPEVIIENRVIDLIKKYVVTCLYNIIFMDVAVDNLSIKYNEMQRYVLQYKRDYKDYNLDYDQYNYTLQAFVYVITALVDWLELDEITPDEIESALQIIILSSFKPRLSNIKRFNREMLAEKRKISEFNIFYIKSLKNINMAFRDLGLEITEDNCSIIMDYIFMLNFIQQLDSKCLIYDSQYEDVVQFNKILREAFIGCYDINFMYSETEKDYFLTVSGMIQPKYLRQLLSDPELKFLPEDASKDAIKSQNKNGIKVTMTYSHISDNIGLVYFVPEYNILDDRYIQKQMSANNSYLEQFYKYLERSYKILTYT